MCASSCQLYLKVFAFLADGLLLLPKLTELLSGDAEFLLDLLLPGFDHPGTLSQNSDHLVAFLQLLCTDSVNLCPAAAYARVDPRGGCPHRPNVCTSAPPSAAAAGLVPRLEFACDERRPWR